MRREHPGLKSGAAIQLGSGSKSAPRGGGLRRENVLPARLELRLADVGPAFGGMSWEHPGLKYFQSGVPGRPCEIRTCALHAKAAKLVRARESIASPPPCGADFEREPTWIAAPDFQSGVPSRPCESRTCALHAKAARLVRARESIASPPPCGADFEREPTWIAAPDFQSGVPGRSCEPRTSVDFSPGCPEAPQPTTRTSTPLYANLRR